MLLKKYQNPTITKPKTNKANKEKGTKQNRVAST